MSEERYQPRTFEEIMIFHMLENRGLTERTFFPNPEWYDIETLLPYILEKFQKFEYSHASIQKGSILDILADQINHIIRSYKKSLADLEWTFIISASNGDIQICKMLVEKFDLTNVDKLARYRVDFKRQHNYYPQFIPDDDDFFYDLAYEKVLASDKISVGRKIRISRWLAREFPISFASISRLAKFCIAALKTNNLAINKWFFRNRVFNNQNPEKGEQISMKCIRYLLNSQDNMDQIFEWALNRFETCLGKDLTLILKSAEIDDIIIGFIKSGKKDELGTIFDKFHNKIGTPDNLFFEIRIRGRYYISHCFTNQQYEIAVLILRRFPEIRMPEYNIDFIFRDLILDSIHNFKLENYNNQQGRNKTKYLMKLLHIIREEYKEEISNAGKMASIKLFQTDWNKSLQNYLKTVSKFQN